MGHRRSLVRVSKLLSLMLRHRPEEFDLEVDRFGFAGLDDVLDALQERDADIGMEDVEAVVYDSEKQRFEISEGRIRARYGHSFPVEIGTDPVEPPEFLYKGVHPRDVNQVLSGGLTPFDRQYVHLSFDPEVAAQLGGPRGERGAVIQVEALKAHQGGVAFYDCGPTILTPEVPPGYLVLYDGPAESTMVPGPVSAPREQPQTSDESGPVTYGRRRKFGSRR